MGLAVDPEVGADLYVLIGDRRFESFGGTVPVTEAVVDHSECRGLGAVPYAGEDVELAGLEGIFVELAAWVYERDFGDPKPALGCAGLAHGRIS
jgi:hypothetical protein